MVAPLDPGWFACVMASGIISVGAEELGFHLLSVITVRVAEVAFVVLLAAYLAQALTSPDHLKASVRDPRTATAYLAVVAGTNVIGIRLIMAGHPLPSVVLAAGSGLLWVLLSYGVPFVLVSGSRRSVLRDVDGRWLLWVVAVQSLAIVAAGLASSAPWSSLRQGLPAVALSFWLVGVVLYLVLIVVICLRLLLVEMTPAEMGPAYWITMGAAAISVTAASGILDIHDRSAGILVNEMHSLLVGSSVVLWAFGTLWILLLAVFGVWRHVLRRYPFSFEPNMWSAVFPLGMYTVASVSLGRAADIGFMVALAKVWMWVGFGAWVATLALMLVSPARSQLRRLRPVTHG
jgi:tellurite resistance protein TehA-like permease